MDLCLRRQLMRKNKTMPVESLQSYINNIQTKDFDLLILARYLAAKSNGLFEVCLIQKRKSDF